MDRPGSPRQLELHVLRAHANSPTSSARKVLFSLGRIGTPERAGVAQSRPSLVQEHLQRFKLSLQDPEHPTGYAARHKVAKNHGKSSVDIAPQLRAMGAISQERLAVDVSSILGPRPSWEDTRAHVGGPPLVQGEYVAKFDRSLQRYSHSAIGGSSGGGGGGGSAAARIALLSQLAAGSAAAAELSRNGGRRVPSTSQLWTDIAELRGPRRLRQYISERKRDSEGPLELLTDVANGWDELRQRQRQQQRQEASTSPVGGAAGVGPTVSVNRTAVAAGPAAAPADPAAAATPTTEHAPPPPVVYVAESDWPTAAAAVVAAAAAAAGAPASLSSLPSAASLLAPQPSSVSTAGSVTRLVDGVAKPAPSSVVLVRFPQKAADGGGAAAADFAASASAAAPTALVSAPLAAAATATLPPPLPPRPPPSAPRRAVSINIPALLDRGGGGGAAAAGGGPPDGPSAAAVAAAAGFVPSLERYHTTFTLPSRALTTGADKLSPRTLVSSTRLVEVVEVVQPARLRPPLRLSDSNGGSRGGWATAAAGATTSASGGDVFAAPRQPVRRHSVADPVSWAAGIRVNYGGGGGGGGIETTAAAANRLTGKLLPMGPALPVPAWASAATADATSAAVEPGAGGGAGDGIAPQPSLESVAATAKAVLQAQRWKRLAANPAAGTQIDPAAFAHVTAVAEEAAMARTLGLVPALATSASQIVVLPPTPPSLSAAAAAIAAIAAPPPGPQATKRMKDQTVTQLEKRWSLTARATAAAAASATATTASPSAAASFCAISPSSSLRRLPQLSQIMSAASSLSGGSSVLASVVSLSTIGGGGSSMGIIHEGREEDEENEQEGPSAALPPPPPPPPGQQQSLRAGTATPPPPPVQAIRSEPQISEWRMEWRTPSTVSSVSLLSAVGVGGGAGSLPPRPSLGALRSRSMASIFPAAAASAPGRAGRVILPDGGSNGGAVPVRRVRVQEPPPPAEAASRMSALRHESLRRLLSDQIRVAAMVYGSGEPEDSESEPMEEEADEAASALVQPLQPAPSAPAVLQGQLLLPSSQSQPLSDQQLLPPQRQPQSERTQQRTDSGRQQQGLEGKLGATAQESPAPAPASGLKQGHQQPGPLPLQGLAAPEGVQPAFSQRGFASGVAAEAAVAAGDAAAPAAAAAGDSTCTNISGATETIDGPGPSTGLARKTTAVDHNAADLSPPWVEGYRTTSGFFTADSSDRRAAARDGGPASAAPSSPGTIWIRANSLRSLVSISSTSGSANNSTSGAAEAVVAADPSRASAAIEVAVVAALPTSKADQGQGREAVKPKKKKAAFASGDALVSTTTQGGVEAHGRSLHRRGGRHRASPRARPPVHSTPKRSGGGFLLISNEVIGRGGSAAAPRSPGSGLAPAAAAGAAAAASKRSKTNVSGHCESGSAAMVAAAAGAEVAAPATAAVRAEVAAPATAAAGVEEMSVKEPMVGSQQCGERDGPAASRAGAGAGTWGEGEKEVAGGGVARPEALARPDERGGGMPDGRRMVTMVY